MLESMGQQRIRHDLVTEQQQYLLYFPFCYLFVFSLSIKIFHDIITNISIFKGYMVFHYINCREEKWSNIYHPKMSLSHADYFKLKTPEAQKIQEETLIFCLRLKECRYRTYSLNRSITRDNYKECGLGMVEAGSRDESLLCPTVTAWPTNIYLPTFCFSNSLSMAFLSFQAPNHYPQHLPLSLSEDAF